MQQLCHKLWLREAYECSVFVDTVRKTMTLFRVGYCVHGEYWIGPRHLEGPGFLKLLWAYWIFLSNLNIVWITLWFPFASVNPKLCLYWKVISNCPTWKPAAEKRRDVRPHELQMDSFSSVGKYFNGMLISTCKTTAAIEFHNLAFGCVRPQTLELTSKSAGVSLTVLATVCGRGHNFLRHVWISICNPPQKILQKLLIYFRILTAVIESHMISCELQHNSVTSIQNILRSITYTIYFAYS